MNTEHACYCGGSPSGTSFSKCCGPALNAECWPSTAEALMRSRYSAFATGNDDHLFRTWHPRFRPAEVTTDHQIRWCGLQILEVVGGSKDDETGIVEFLATMVQNGVEETLRERSRFSKRAGRWMYEQGEHRFED